MTTMIEAIYHNGALIPKRRLEHIREGQTVRVIVAAATEPEDASARFWRFVDAHTITLPPDYHFQREELYER
ncbi:MAG: antitoxin family protein [Anaerolineae bacterium]